MHLLYGHGFFAGNTTILFNIITTTNLAVPSSLVWRAMLSVTSVFATSPAVFSSVSFSPSHRSCRLVHAFLLVMLCFIYFQSRFWFSLPCLIVLRDSSRHVSPQTNSSTACTRQQSLYKRYIASVCFIDSHRLNLFVRVWLRIPF